MIPNAIRSIQEVATMAPDLKKLKKATDGLEAFMFKSLIKNMGGKDGLFSSKMPGSDVYKDMFEQNLSEVIAERGQIGIGKTIFNSVAPLAAQQALRQAHKNSTIEKKA